MVSKWDANATGSSYDYDLFVIGGGSGGLSAAKTAAGLNKKVACADFVKPSPQGTTWGLGGTCVNVGCIPKKLFHYAATLAEARHDQNLQGWNIDQKQEHNWTKLVQGVNGHIQMLNFGYVNDFSQTGVKYFNKYASFVDPHTIKLDDGKGNVEQVTADKIIIATGGRPSYPDIPGAKEFGITSDDLFSLKKAPGKTLVVGASYVALECAGFLTALGYDTKVMVRSIFLRGFDQDMADRIAEYMGTLGTKFLRKSEPQKLEKLDNGKIKVTWCQGPKKEEKSEEFDTVLFAIGRYAVTAGCELANAGLKPESNGKFIVNEQEQTNVDHIYAIGDIQHGKLELTPTAIKAGMLLAKRLYEPGFTELMNYNNVPTTVFTPLEYGTVGLSEEDARAKYPEDLYIKHVHFKPLEWALNFSHSDKDHKCYVKVIVQKSTDLVVGFHILSPNAGEITQGIGIAFQCGMTKKQLDACVGIHPTVAEECCTLTWDKDEFPFASKEGC